MFGDSLRFPCFFCTLDFALATPGAPLLNQPDAPCPSPFIPDFAGCLVVTIRPLGPSYLGVGTSMR